MTASPVPLVNVAMPRVLAEHFLTLSDYITDRMGAAGCNDFCIDDTPESRILAEMLDARNYGMTLEEYRKSDDYTGPNLHAGKIYLMDFQVVYMLEACIQQALEGKVKRNA